MARLREQHSGEMFTDGSAIDALLEQDELITRSLAVSGSPGSRIARLGIPSL
jgi:hypothetical protein